MRSSKSSPGKRFFAGDLFGKALTLSLSGLLNSSELVEVSLDPVALLLLGVVSTLELEDLGVFDWTVSEVHGVPQTT
ncbi:hypothetical protein DPMN_010836 [Dreissena polymorpha]|uniref:Uncharacterized protein n=1 Tax=Dreissena polymorpha TaxID=45954 RepID=A0A9D4N2R9_DREPO|nr:hypothetical protein DPMN_010836 [Dreissena polymorpha]